MATSQQPPAQPSAAEAQACTSCGAPLAPDQRYCLSCGARRGEPRVSLPTPPPPTEPLPQPTTPATAVTRTDVSPLAAVIGIALLGGMLLIGVLIGRGDTSNDPAPAPIVQVGDPTSTATTTTSTTGAGDTTTTGAGDTTTTGGDPSVGPAAIVTSEWPQGTDGYTVELNTLPKQGTTSEAVDAAKATAREAGAADAAVLDSDLYPTLAPGSYVIYSGVFTDRKSAEAALKPLTKGFPAASVVHVSSSAPTGGASGGPAAGASDSTPPDGSVQPGNGPTPGVAESEAQN